MIRRPVAVLVAVLVVVLVAVLGVGAWATHQGYVPPLTGWSCAMVYDPRPYDELVAAGYTPYCARSMHDENWW